jgi:hypothetical protein
VQKKISSSRYVKRGDEQTMENIVMTVDDLRAFLRDAQDVDSVASRTREEVQRLIDEYEPNTELQKEQKLSLDGRCFFFSISEEVTERMFSRLSESSSRRRVLGDETLVRSRGLSRHDTVIFGGISPWKALVFSRPLADYYINTSHNRYLTRENRVMTALSVICLTIK